MNRVLFYLSLLLAALIASPATAQTFPALTGRVVDAANVIPPDVEAQLDEKLAAFEQRNQRQFVVATVPSLEDRDIVDYGYRLGRAWGIGDEKRNDGVILLVAPTERKVRIEVGYGLEPVLTDGYSTLIVQNTILPKFKAGDMPGGIVAGTDAIIKQLELPADQAAEVAKQATAEPRDQGFPIGTLIWFAFLFFFFILPMFAGRKGRRYRGGSGMGGAVGNIILWEALNAAARSGRDSGGWGGGGFGGGGFSGGGGSFGGGGASGGW